MVTWCEFGRLGRSEREGRGAPYDPHMVATALWMRVAGFLLIAAGAMSAVIGNVSLEPLNRAGLAPSALVGFAVIALGSLVLIAAYQVRTRQFQWLPLPAILALLVVLAVGTMLMDQARPSEYWRGLRGPFGYVVVGGFAVFYGTAVVTVSYLVVAGGTYVLSWPLDLIPPLRSRAVGASMRRAWRSPFRDPS